MSCADTGRWSDKWERALLIVVLWATAAIRLFGLASVPPGLHFDEAVYGLMARDILAGARPVFFSAYTGREPLYMYCMALLMAGGGSSAYVIRLTSAFAGIATVALAYGLASRWFGRRVGIAAAILLATNYWHVTVSRNGYPNVLIPPLAAASALCLWQGWQRGQARSWLLGGAFSGLVLYTYLAARLWPAFLVAALAYGLLVEPERRRARLGGAALALLAAGCVVAPLTWHFLQHPADFWQRAGQVLGWSEATARELLATYGRNLRLSLVGFVRHGDPRWHYNLPGRAVFEPWLAVLALAGVLWCLSYWRSVRAGIVLLWVAIMMLPGVLTVELQPASQRMFGIFPALVFLPALGLTEGVVWAGKWLAHWRLFRLAPCTIGRAVTAVTVLAGMLVGGRTVRDYFFDWARQPETAHIFNADYVTMAEAAERDRRAGRLVVLLSEHYRHPTIAFLAPELVAGAVWSDPRVAVPLPAPSGHGFDGTDRGQVTVAYYRPRMLVAEDAPASRWLEEQASSRSVLVPRSVEALAGGRSKPGAGHEASGGSTSKGPLHQGAMIPIGQPATEGRPWPEVVRYEVPWSEHWRPENHDVRIAEELAIRSGVSVLKVQRDEILEVPVQWRVLARPAGGRRFALHLRDADGVTWAQADVAGYLASEWRPGDQVWQWLRVELDRTMPPGVYGAHLMVVDDTDRPLPVRQAEGVGTELVVARVLVDDDGRKRLPSGAPVEQRLDGLDVVWHRPLADEVAPGSSVTAEILWRRATPVTDAEEVIFELCQPRGCQVAHRSPLARGYPPRRWAENELLRGRYRFRIPANVSDGQYDLLARLAEGRDSILLGTLRLRAGERRFAPVPGGWSVEARFDHSLRLLRCDVRPQRIERGGTFTVTLQWQALRSGLPDATVFVHLYDPVGRIVSQDDSVPAGGKRPLPGWLLGEVIIDHHVLQLPQTVGPGQHRLVVGLYDPASGLRWSVSEDRPASDQALRLPLRLRSSGRFLVVEGP